MVTFHSFLYVYQRVLSKSERVAPWVGAPQSLSQVFLPNWQGSTPRLRREWRGQRPTETPLELGRDRNLRMDRDGRMLEAGGLLVPKKGGEHVGFLAAFWGYDGNDSSPKPRILSRSILPFLMNVPKHVDCPSCPGIRLKLAWLHEITCYIVMIDDCDKNTHVYQQISTYISTYICIYIYI